MNHSQGECCEKCGGHFSDCAINNEPAYPNESCNCGGCLKPTCPCHKNTYSHASHTHCWDNPTPPCGIPLEKHTQCCLCELSTPVREEDTLGKPINILEYAKENGVTEPESHYMLMSIEQLDGIEARKRAEEVMHAYSDELLQRLEQEVGKQRLAREEDAVERGYNIAITDTVDLITNFKKEI